MAPLVPPYHFQRCPRQRAEFDTGNCLFGAERAAQAIAEIRALTGWLLGEGCPAVSLRGYSLGAAFAGMTVYHRKALEKQKAAREALDKTPMNMALSQPVIPKENILLIQGRYDLVVEAEIIEELWQIWKQPEIWRLPHGHISWMFTPGLTRRVLCWLAPRMILQSQLQSVHFELP